MMMARKEAASARRSQLKLWLPSLQENLQVELEEVSLFLKLQRALVSGLLNRFRPIREVHPQIRNILDHALLVNFHGFRHCE